MNHYRKRLDSLLVEYRLVSRQVEAEKETLATLQEELTSIEEARVILQEIARNIQESVHRQVGEIVSRCLDAVFGEDSYEFRINFVSRRNRTEAELALVRDGEELSPLDSVGGGVVDVVSFALRLAWLVLVRPTRRRILCLDESFRHLSEEYRPRVRELLEVLAEEFSLQILQVSHSKHLMIGKVVEL